MNRHQISEFCALPIKLSCQILQPQISLLDNKKQKPNNPIKLNFVEEREDYKGRESAWQYDSYF